MQPGRGPGRQLGPLRRASGHLRPRTTFVVVTEGRRTEPEYLALLRSFPEVRQRSALEILPCPEGSQPAKLVEVAISRLAWERARGGEVDQVWCVFDVEAPDPHPDLLEAYRQAERAGVEVAVSNPCFELWLLLHFEDVGRAPQSREACELRARQDRSSGKGVDASSYSAEAVRSACRRAEALETRHAREGRPFPDDNPSSGMHRLVRALGVWAGDGEEAVADPQ